MRHLTLILSLLALTFAACDDGGGTETQFSPLEDEYQDQCYQRCAEGGVDPDECDRACAEIDLNPCYEGCLDEGISEEDCRIRCYDRPEEAVDPEADACYQACLDDGGDEIECRELCY